MGEFTREARTERFDKEFGKDVCSGGVNCPEPGTILEVESCRIVYDATSGLGRVGVFLRGRESEWALLTPDVVFNPEASGETLVGDTVSVTGMNLRDASGRLLDEEAAEEHVRARLKEDVGVVLDVNEKTGRVGPMTCWYVGRGTTQFDSPDVPRECQRVWRAFQMWLEEMDKAM